MGGNFIGIHGKMGAGKDTVADYLCLRYGFRKISIGRHIRREIVKIRDCNDYISTELAAFARYSRDERQSVVSAKPLSDFGRICLQQYGTIKRRQNPKHWTSMLGCEIRDRSQDSLVWSDIRTVTEMDLLRDLGLESQIVRIIRPRLAITSSIYQHVTETELDSTPMPTTLVNEGTIPELFESVDALVRILAR